MPRGLNARDRALRLAQRQLNDDIATIMALPEGRRLIAHVIYEVAHVNRQSAGQDAEATYYNEGARSVGLALSSAIFEAHPDAYLLMVDETLRGRVKEMENARRSSEVDPDGDPDGDA